MHPRRPERELPRRHIEPVGCADLLRSVTFVRRSVADAARHNRIVALVEQMLDPNRQLADARTEQDKTFIRREIEVTDRRIDALVMSCTGCQKKRSG